MGAELIFPSIQAGILLANFITSTYALYAAGHMTDEQLQAAWAAAGIKVQAADNRLQAAEDAALARSAPAGQAAPIAAAAPVEPIAAAAT